MYLYIFGVLKFDKEHIAIAVRNLVFNVMGRVCGVDCGVARMRIIYASLFTFVFVLLWCGRTHITILLLNFGSL